MLHAAKIMAVAALDLYDDPQHLQRARQEFEAATRDRPYQSPIPDTVRPPRYEDPGGS
jgi:aminobenzoyl-glutamate utilization protein B